MQSNLEDLHRQASGHYLKGDFPAAIEAWQAVLRQQPDDERAREGIRLCEQLAGGFDPAAGPPAAEPSAADGGLALDLTPIEPAPVPSPGEAVDAPPVVPLPAVSAAAERPVQVDAAAADELRRRTETLLYEAQQQFELGKADDALKTLGRVLILDEDNGDARSLRARIESERGSGQPPLSAAGPAAAVASEGFPALDLEADLEAAAQAEPAAQTVPGLTSNGDPVPQDLLVDPPPLAVATDPTSSACGAPAEEPGDPSAPPEAAAVPTTKPRASKSGLPAWLQDRRLALGLVGGILTLIALAFVKMSGSVALPPEPLVAADPALPAAEAGGPESEPATGPDRAPGSAPQDTAALMSKAQQAFGSEDYAAAIVAYGTILEREPDHVEAGASLKVAVARYREQQERKEQWEQAVEAFEEGNYAQALRSFYRMPDDDYAADLERHKVNGWYNLGVLALQANDCGRAVENLEEAQRLDPDDEGVLIALDLADLCHGPAVKEDIRNLRLRGLND